MKRIISPLICFFILILFESSGLCQPQQVVASAGKSTASNGIELSWTLGQVMTHSQSSNSIYLGSGFQQGSQIISVVSGLSAHDQKISIYPNPTTEYLSINPATGPYKGSFQLINLLGKVVLEEHEVDFTTKQVIDMYNFSDGGYILKIVIDDSPEQRFKIIKQ